MPQKVNYYAVLSRALAALDRDAYGARGAVYDREHRGLLRRLASADPPCSEDEIAQEEEAFRDAIRRIEFPESSAPAAVAERREAAEVRPEPAEPPRPEPAEMRPQRPEMRPQPAEMQREPAEPQREPSEPRRQPADRRRDPADLPRELAEPWREAAERWREPAERRREPVQSRREPPEVRREPPPRRPEPSEPRREPPVPPREPVEMRGGSAETRREPMWESAVERPRSRREPEQDPPDLSERRPSREPRWPRDLDDEGNPRQPPVRRGEGARREGPPLEPEGEDKPPDLRPRSLFRRIFFYTQIILAVLLAAALAYALATSDIDLSWLAASPNAASPQRAALYDTKGGNRSAPILGKATWRTTTETGASDKPETVVMLEAEIPERSLAMTVTIGRDSESGAAMSHVFEISFARPEQLPFGGISSVPKIVMKEAETDPGDDLVGTGTRVGPGSYLFGLLGTPDSIQRNIQLLRTRRWLGVLINFADGQAQMLNAEKGASGQKAIDEALAKWGQ
jgi:hypothetical protein